MEDMFWDARYRKLHGTSQRCSEQKKRFYFVFIYLFKSESIKCRLLFMFLQTDGALVLAGDGMLALVCKQQGIPGVNQMVCSWVINLQNCEQILSVVLDLSVILDTNAETTNYFPVSLCCPIIHVSAVISPYHSLM